MADDYKTTIIKNIDTNIFLICGRLDILASKLDNLLEKFDKLLILTERSTNLLIEIRYKA